MFGKHEFEHWAKERKTFTGAGKSAATKAAAAGASRDFKPSSLADAVYAQSVAPIVASSMHELVEMDAVLVDIPDVARISLMPTPGHVCVVDFTEGPV